MAAKQLQIRRGTTAEHTTFTGAPSEITVDTDKDTIVVHDGFTAGGHPLATAQASDDLRTDFEASELIQDQLVIDFDASEIIQDQLVIDFDASELVQDQLVIDFNASEIIQDQLVVDLDTLEGEVNMTPAKELAAMNITNMIYDGNSNLTDITYEGVNNSEVLTYGEEGLDNVAHTLAGVLAGNTALTYTDGSLTAAIFTAV